MKTFLVSIYMIVYGLLQAQPNMKLFYKPLKRGFVLYAANYEHLPLSVSINLVLYNLKVSGKDDKIYVIPGTTDSFKLYELQAVDIQQRYQFSWSYRSNLGDVNLQNYDSGYVYDLPYRKGKTYSVYQGYNGKLSHQNENALDFPMPEGTEILAAREGIVARVIQNNSSSCPSSECAQYNNYISIYHPDGTFAIYAHLQLNGAVVKQGDVVKKGDLIAYSGNTGWTNGPHLHFACYLPRMEKDTTITTKFKLNSKNDVDYLKEKVTYHKDY